MSDRLKEIEARLANDENAQRHGLECHRDRRYLLSRLMAAEAVVRQAEITILEWDHEREHHATLTVYPSRMSQVRESLAAYDAFIAENDK